MKCGIWIAECGIRDFVKIGMENVGARGASPCREYRG
jgi:hypothetical protein